MKTKPYTMILAFVLVLAAVLGYNAVQTSAMSAQITELTESVKLLTHNQNTTQAKIEALEAKVKELEESQKKLNEFVDPEIPLSLPLQFFTIQQAKLKKIAPDLLYAIMEQESGFDVDCIYRNRNGSTDFGLCQINSSNFGWLREEHGLDPMNTKDNIRAACIILENALERSDGDLFRALTGYNTGSVGHVNEYAREVLNRYEKNMSYMRRRI